MTGALLRGRGGRLVACVLAAGALIALAGASASPASPAGPVPAAVGDDLLPDLLTRPIQELYVQGANLRLSNTIANRGVGPVEIYPEPTAGGDCDGDGHPNNDRIAFQRIFQDSADPRSPGYFVRGQDTASTSRQVGCMVYHPAHSHWHFEDFARYVLRREPDAATVGRATKVSFCVIDTDHPFPDTPGSPGSGHYGNNGCGASSIEGLSVGWADTYSAFLEGQSIPVAGLAAGDYCLIARADPVDRLRELNDSNNSFRTRIHLDPAAHQVQVLTGACQLGG
jgi:Lysyl oxidase